MKNRAGVLLSGEKTTVPMAEVKALFLAYDPGSKFNTPEERFLIVESEADPELVSGRVAFSRRVGLLLDRASEAEGKVRGRKVRFRSFQLCGSKEDEGNEAQEALRGLDAKVDLEDPEFEFTSVHGKERYLLLTRPRSMRQGWSQRRPRRRAFFHPSAIFPKLSRAMVNLTRVKQGETLLDPFAGTGSILIEAAEIGVNPLAIDLSSTMGRGALANMRKQGQEWLGVVRGDSFKAPVTRVDAIATDVPYGRASSTRGRLPADVVGLALVNLPAHLAPGHRMVLLHPKEIAVSSSAEIEVEEEHDLYIHKKLTRTMTVLRKR